MQHKGRSGVPFFTDEYRKRSAFFVQTVIYMKAAVRITPCVRELFAGAEPLRTAKLSEPLTLFYAETAEMYKEISYSRKFVFS